MSSLLGIAFDDVNEKVTIIRNRCKDYDGQFIGFFSIVEIEKKKDLLNLNGENNSKYTKDKVYISIYMTA